MPTAHDLWQRKNCTRIYLRLNNHTDADILSWLQQQESVAGYIREIIRQDMRKEKPNEQMYNNERQEDIK